MLLNDRDPDQDTHLPDNRKVLIPAAGAATSVHGAHISGTVAAATGNIASFEAVGGSPAVTKVIATAHGLNTGEEIRIGGTAVEAYNGQFPVTRVDDNSFTVPVPSPANFQEVEKIFIRHYTAMMSGQETIADGTKAADAELNESFARLKQQMGG